MEYKSISFDLKLAEPGESNDWILEGYASTYDIDSGNDRILKGAFIKTIQDRFFNQKALNGKSKIKVLWQHNTEDLIGSILDLKEDSNGLFCRIQLFKDPVFVSAEKAYRLAKYGEIDSFSIGYKPTSWDYEEDDSDCRIRVIKELKLYEISVVTFPMNEKAEFTNVKADEEFTLMNDRVVELLTEIKSLLEQSIQVKSEVIVTEEVATKEEPVMEVKAECKGCGKPMKMMCPECGEGEEEEDSEKSESVDLNQLVADLAALKSAVADLVSVKETEVVVVESVVEEEKTDTEEPTEVKLEDLFEFFLNKEFNL